MGGQMTRRFGAVIAVLSMSMAAVPAFGQISFQATGAYAGLGDSVAAGTGAMPATNGYVYELYERGVFGPRQTTAFANAAVRGARSWDLRDHQVPQILCATMVQRPTVVTITAGANDLFGGDLDVSGIALRVAQAVNLLLNNPLLPTPVLDPVTGQPCPALAGVTILVSNYYSVPHPDPLVFQQLDLLLQGFAQALQLWLAQVQVPPGARLAIVDLYTPSLGRQGLVQIERRLGFSGPLAFDPHPTNLGHAFIAREFERAWRALPN